MAPKIITFEQFQSTGVDCDDLGKALDDALWDDMPEPGRGRLYLEYLYIERKPEAGWPNGSDKQWHLIVERDSYLSDDLAELEHLLYEFAIEAGYIDG